MKHGKKYLETAKAVDRTKLYDPDEAIAVVKKAAVAYFDETIEAAMSMIAGTARSMGIVVED